MKKWLFIIVVLCLIQKGLAQNNYIKIMGSNQKETAIIDSIGYTKKNSSKQKSIEILNSTINSLQEIGYLETNLKESSQENDSLFVFQIKLEKQTKWIAIYIGRNKENENKILINNIRDTVVLPFGESKAFLKNYLSSLEKMGYSTATVQLKNFKINKNKYCADLIVTYTKQRFLNEIKTSGFENFPKGQLKYILKKYQNKVFNNDVLKKIQSDFNQFPYVVQTKKPAVLFTTDSTKIYVYLQKAKSNRFDGLIGFVSDQKNKLSLTGFLDIHLLNILKMGEKFSVLWKSETEFQKSFETNLEIPYVFGSKLALKTALNIYKQDSTFQNTKTNIGIGYCFDFNTRLYLSRQSTSSVAIQKLPNALISNYENQFGVFEFEFEKPNLEMVLFPEKTQLRLKIGLGNSISKSKKNEQAFLNFTAKHDLFWQKRNSLALKTQWNYLKSNQYLENELYRFGGINSVRGFVENSISSRSVICFSMDYRYLLADNLYFHSVSDYCFFENYKTPKNNSLLGLGFGFGLLTKNGLLNLVYANGSVKNQEIQLSNSIVQIKFQSNF